MKGNVMRIFKKRIFIFLVLLFVFLAYSLNSQILSPELPRSKFELGYAFKKFHRNTKQQDFDWGFYSVFFKYGITEWLTLSGEGCIYTMVSERFPDRDYRITSVGVGITGRFFKKGNFSMAVAYHYHEDFSFDRSRDRYHKNTRNRVCSFQFEYTVIYLRQNATIWIAPAYISDDIIQYPYNSYVRFENKSINNIGFIFGGNILLLNHIEVFSHILYADFFQYRYGIGYQF